MLKMVKKANLRTKLKNSYGARAEKTRGLRSSRCTPVTVLDHHHHLKHRIPSAVVCRYVCHTALRHIVVITCRCKVCCPIFAGRPVICHCACIDMHALLVACSPVVCVPNGEQVVVLGICSVIASSCCTYACSSVGASHCVFGYAYGCQLDSQVAECIQPRAVV